MKLILNGKPTEAKPHSTITEFLTQLGLEGKPVVIELNEIAILPRKFSETLLKDGDKLEVIALAAGG